MTHIITLSELDICQIIARTFNVKPGQVRIYLEETTTGYGGNEQIEQIPKARIKLDDLELDWEKNAPLKKMSKREIMNRSAELNASRREKLGCKIEALNMSTIEEE